MKDHQAPARPKHTPKARVSLVERVKHLTHEVHELTQKYHHVHDRLESIMATAADLTTAVAALTDAVATLEAAPKPVALIDQPTLDAAVQGVTEATAKVVAATPSA